MIRSVPLNRNPLPDSTRPNPLSLFLHHDGRIEADPVIPDRAKNRPGPTLYLNRRMGRLSVLAHVGQGLLNDPVKDRFDGGGETAIPPAFNSYGKGRPLRNALSEKFERRQKPQIVQNRRPKLVREAAQLPLNLIQKPPYLLETLAKAGRKLRPTSPSAIWTQARTPGFVVQRMATVCFLFKLLVQPSQRAIGARKPRWVISKGVRLDKKIASFTTRVLSSNPGKRQNFTQRLMMQHRHLQQAHSLRQGPPPNL